MEQVYLPGHISDRIQDQLRERKITQAELAGEIGISPSTLSRFLSGNTAKIGNESVIKIAGYFGVSTDFILGQTDFPERRNYDIGELGLSYRAAMALYRREVDTDVVNRMLESPRFPEVTRMISRYFDDTFAQGFAARNALLDSIRQMATGSTSYGQDAREAAAQAAEAQKIAPQEADISAIEAALMDMLREIKAGIQSGTPATEKATKELTEAMMETVSKGGGAAPATPQDGLEQISKIYASLPGATPEMGGEFAGLVKDFLSGAVDIARRQGLVEGGDDGPSGQ